MKKAMTYALVLLLVTILTVGGTYAFFTATTTSNSLAGETHQLEVIYTGDTEINGNLNLVKTKEEGWKRTISIGLSETSVGASANLYISISQITATLANDALNWELYQLIDNTETYVNSGTFLDCGAIGASKSKCSSGDRIYMLTGYELSTTPTQYVIYLWLDGYKVGNEVLGATLKGYIGAESNQITGILE